MSTTLQFRRATTAELASITGAEGEIIIDLTKDTVTVHDGSAAGGVPLATESYVDNAVFDATDFDSNFSGKTTDDLTEGATNKYFSDALARSSVSASGDLSYNQSTGVFSFTERTDAEVRGLFSASGDLSYNSSTGGFSVTTYKSTDFDTDFANKDTDDLAEGATNKYYSDVLVDTHLVGGTGVTYNAGTISIGQDVGTSSNVTFNNVSVNGTLSSDDITASTVTTSGDLVVQGSLTINGATTTVESNTVNIGDSILTLNSDLGGTTAPSQNAGFTVNRGSSADKSFIWDEANDYWSIAGETLVAGAFSGDIDYNDITNPPTIGDGTVTFSTGGGLSGSGSITMNQTGSETITISHADTSSQSSVNGSGNTFIQDVTLDTYGHVTGLGTATVVIPDTANDATITLSAGNALTGGGNFTTDQSTNETITFAVASNAIGADELNVSGNGTNGQALLSDGDGTFTWGSAGLSVSDLNALDPIQVGRSNTASGTASSTFGRYNTASGSGSSAVGSQCVASGTYSSAIGYKNTASGTASSAFGYTNTASASRSSAFGYRVEVTTASVQEFGKWGFSSNPREGAIRIHDTGMAALTIENTATAYSASTATAGAEADGELADGMFAFRRDGTDVYLDGNFGGTIETKAIGAGLDTAGLNSLNPTELGNNNTASSYSSAVGLSNNASGSVSSAFGKENVSSGVYSSAFGFENSASAISSSAFGYKNNASASSSSAFGYQNNASGDDSSAMGWGVNVSTNKVQEFGKWLNDSNRGGAIRIHETGMAALTIQNTATAYTASVASDGAEADGSLADGMFAFRRDGTDVYLDGNFGGTIETKPIGASTSIADDTTTNSTFYPTLSDSTSGSFGTATISSTKLYFNPSTGSLNATEFNALSDKNLKENVETIENGLDVINQIRPVSFDWKDSGEKSFGVIAQEIEEILPQVVATNDEGIKSVAYDNIIAFLIDAVKTLDERTR